MSMFFMNFKRNMKNAFITVKGNFKEYVCLLLAIAMVETLFGVLTVSFCNDRKVEKKLILENGYDYHCSIDGLTESDYNVITSEYEYLRTQKLLSFSIENRGSRCLFTFQKHYARNMEKVVELASIINEKGVHVTVNKTPLYQYDLDRGIVAKTLIPLLLFLMVLSFFLLMALFRIRINHFKFTYSIYLTFGGDYKKLLSGVFYETVLLVALSFPAAVLLSFGAAALLYLPKGYSLYFFFAPLPVMLLCTTVCAALALLLPIRILASTMPVKLMKAADNSNLVTSPRKSANLFRKPSFTTELWSLWRYRKYVVTLLLSTVTFAVVFLLGSYLADAYTVRSSTTSANFTVRIENAANREHFISNFVTYADEEGMSYAVEKAVSDSRNGEDSPSFAPPQLILHKSMAKGGYYSPCIGNEDFVATEALEIRPFDGEALQCISSIYGYGIVGDPSKLLTDPDTVIVSETLANHKANSLKPGDTVYLSVNHIPIPGVRTDAEGLSSEETRLQNNISTYRAFTVAAVVQNYSNYTDMLLYLPAVPSGEEESSYAAVVGCEPDYSEIRVYLDSEEDEENTSIFLQYYASKFGGISVDSDYATLSDTVRESKNYHGLILLISFLVLAVSPLAGMFSQVLFYDKRQLEFDVLRAVGATGKNLRAIFLADGIVIGLLSAGFYAGFAFLFVRLFCLFLNSPYAFMFSDSLRATTFYPAIPKIPFLIGLGITLVFSVFAVLLPALRYKRKSDDHISANFAEADEL